MKSFKLIPALALCLALTGLTAIASAAPAPGEEAGCSQGQRERNSRACRGGERRQGSGQRRLERISP